MVLGTVLSGAGPPCQCGQPSRQSVSRTAANPNRAFWTCAATGKARCKFFEWAEELAPAPAPAAEAPGPSTPATANPSVRMCPKCPGGQRQMREAVVNHASPGGNAGRRYFKCDACGNFQWAQAVAPPAPLPTVETPGDAEYVVDEPTRRLLQDLFEVPPHAGLGTGRDNREPGPPYDHLKVECAWRVRNPNRTQRYEAFVARLAEGSAAARRLETKTAAAAAALIASQPDTLAPLRPEVNEVLLLHGTKPEHLYDILFMGLDPALSQDGMFGHGTYLAEDAAKADQYTTKDAKWQGAAAAAAQPLHLLHRKLYERGVKHANDVFYALVARVALGTPLVTRDGMTRIVDPDAPAGQAAASGGGPGVPATAPVFAGVDRKALVGAHSLLAETGGLIHRYREFVVTEPAAVSIEYLVALKRQRNYCASCDAALDRRTVSKDSENHGRPVLFCPSHGIQLMPLCHCGSSAKVLTKRDGGKYYGCGANRGFCSFKDWDGPPGGGGPRGSASPLPAASKRARV